MAEGEPKGHYSSWRSEAEKSRTVSDAELIKGGAYWQGEGEGKALILQPEQVDQVYKEFNREALNQAREKIQEKIDYFKERDRFLKEPLLFRGYEGDEKFRNEIIELLDKINPMTFVDEWTSGVGLFLGEYEDRSRNFAKHRIIYYPQGHSYTEPGEPAIIEEESGNNYDYSLEQNIKAVYKVRWAYPTTGERKGQEIRAQGDYFSKEELQELGWSHNR